MLAKLAQVKKAVVAATGVVAVLVAQGLLSGSAERWVEGVLAAATAVLTYFLPNAPADPEV
jgi:hypothetical protein